MKALVAVIFMLSLSCTASAQELTGKWYLINRGGLVEMDISKNTITTRPLFLDFKTKNKPPQTNTYYKVIKLEDRILLVTDSKTDSSKFSATTLIYYRPHVSFQLAWNGLDTATNTIEELISANRNDKRKLYGYSFFNKAYINTLKRLKNISTITLAGFRKYATKYVEHINASITEFQAYNTGYAAATYNFQLIVQSLLAIGYNPLEEMKNIEAAYKKYNDDPEVKKTLGQAKAK